MKPRLCLETTIPSYLVARRSRDMQIAVDQEATESWWHLHRVDFEIFISQVVVREDHARECNYDVHVIFEQMRAETERMKADGWKFVSHAAAQEPSGIVREDPPPP